MLVLSSCLQHTDISFEPKNAAGPSTAYKYERCATAPLSLGSLTALPQALPLRADGCPAHQHATLTFLDISAAAGRPREDRHHDENGTERDRPSWVTMLTVEDEYPYQTTAQAGSELAHTERRWRGEVEPSLDGGVEPLALLGLVLSSICRELGLRDNSICRMQ